MQRAMRWVAASRRGTTPRNSWEPPRQLERETLQQTAGPVEHRDKRAGGLTRTVCDSQFVNPTSAELIHASHREPARSPGWTLWSNGCKLAVAEAGNLRGWEAFVTREKRRSRTV